MGSTQTWIKSFVSFFDAGLDVWLARLGSLLSYLFLYIAIVVVSLAVYGGFRLARQYRSGELRWGERRASSPKRRSNVKFGDQRKQEYLESLEKELRYSTLPQTIKEQLRTLLIETDDYYQLQRVFDLFRWTQGFVRTIHQSNIPEKYQHALMLRSLDEDLLYSKRCLTS